MRRSVEQSEMSPRMPMRPSLVLEFKDERKMSSPCSCTALVQCLALICVEICETNCIDEEEFVETWMAYTVSNLGGADPTVETLTQMERNCLTKTEQETNTSSKQQKKTSSLVIYNASTIDSFL
ncbi:unnamed protein product, partial [Timema podura]|nr:unnamed protein product [Timema podura]